MGGRTRGAGVCARRGHERTGRKGRGMNKSDTIAELAKALATAQGEIENASKNAEIETMPLVAAAQSVRPLKRKAGRAKSGENVTNRFLSSVVFGTTECWHWRKVRPGGYGASEMLGERLAHRVSWKIHHGEIPEGMCVLHKCDVRNCVNPDHLFLGTKADNHRDMVEKGRQPRGFKKPNHSMRGERHPR